MRSAFPGTTKSHSQTLAPCRCKLHIHVCAPFLSVSLHFAQGGRSLNCLVPIPDGNFVASNISSHSIVYFPVVPTASGRHRFATSGVGGQSAAAPSAVVLRSFSFVRGETSRRRNNGKRDARASKLLLLGQIFCLPPLCVKVWSNIAFLFFVSNFLLTTVMGQSLVKYCVFLFWSAFSVR